MSNYFETEQRFHGSGSFFRKKKTYTTVTSDYFKTGVNSVDDQVTFSLIMIVILIIKIMSLISFLAKQVLSNSKYSRELHKEYFVCHLDVMKTVADNIARATKTLYQFSFELSREFSKINCHVNIN